MSTIVKTLTRRAWQAELELEAEVEREWREVFSSKSSITLLISHSHSFIWLGRPAFGYSQMLNCCGLPFSINTHVNISINLQEYKASASSL